MSWSGSIFSRLPGGRRLAAALFPLLAFSMIAASLAFFALSALRPNIGLVLSPGPKGWTVESVSPDGLSAKAGIRAGDRPVEINGEPAQVFLERHAKAGIVFGMLIKEMTVSDRSGQLKSVALEDSSRAGQAVAQLATWALFSLLFWAIGLYVYFNRPKILAARLLCLTGVTFGLILSSNMAAARAVPFALHVHIAASIVASWFMVHFFFVLPEEPADRRDRPAVYLIYLLPAVTLVLYPLVGLADGQPVQWFRSLRLVEYGAGLLAAAGTATLSYFRAASARTRQRLKIVLAGCLAAVIPILILYIFPAVLWKRTILPAEVSILFIGFVPLSMGYAVLTQKLMDIDVIIRRGAVYGLVTMVMAALLSTAILFVLAFRGSLGLPEQLLVALALGVIATVLFGPIKNGIEILVDRFFYRDRYDYRATINSLSISLNKLQDFTETSRLVVGTAVDALNLAGGCLFARMQSGSFEVSAAQGKFADAGMQSRLLTLILSEQRAEIAFPGSAASACPGLAFLIPLVMGEKEAGVLCLSHKINRQEFSSDDLFLLQGLASVASIALHSVLLIRDVSARDTFVSIASHELRTPLTSILGYGELLLRRDLPDATRKKWAKNIVDSAHRLSAMADDLLNVSRIQSGKVNLMLEKVSLPDLFEDQLSMVRGITGKHEFAVDVDSGLSDAFVDRDKFGQVIGNLLSNAVKYSPDGGRITLAARNDVAGHRVVVSVSDQGIGISLTDRDSLFKTFHRIRRPETAGVGGNGLGLYIVKEWTESMRGTVWLESELNKGSTFFVAVPADDSKAKHTTIQAGTGGNVQENTHSRR
ncbi:MAG: hypothetical protein HYX90_08665 [Chloroflexi bacterium]|nr:hypothetical protein [Chloroflexota bacterium]